MPQPDQPHDLAAFCALLKRAYQPPTQEHIRSLSPTVLDLWRSLAKQKAQLDVQIQVVTRG